MKKVSFFILVLFTSLVFSSQIYAQTTVNLIATNDMRGVLEESETAIGIAQVSAIKNSTENSLLIDSGDATQGTALATINKGADVIKLMNAAGYDCMVAGNHEFDYGSEQLLSNADAADFPILSANAVTADGTLLPATHVITKAGKKIGFVGITTSTANTSTNPLLRPDVTFSDEIEAAKTAIAFLQDEVDTIVLLTHLGDNPDVVPVTSKILLDGLSDTELESVSAVLDGHSHTLETEPYVRGEFSIPVIQDQTQLSHVGKVSLVFEDDGSVSATEEVMDYETASAYELTSIGEDAKKTVETTLSQVKSQQDQVTNKVIGNAETPFWGGYVYWDYAEPRIVETNFGDLVTDIFRGRAVQYAEENHLSGQVLGIVNGGGISGSLDPGPITYGNILNTFGHGNTVVILETTPSELYEVLEKGLVVTGQDATGMLKRKDVSGSFIQASGFKYAYNPANPEGSKVTSVTTSDGQSLSRKDTSTKLIIGTQNYVQSLFGNAEVLTQLGSEENVIADFISSQALPLNYPTNGERITIVGDKSPATYQVSIPVYDKSSPNMTLPNEKLRVQIDRGYFQSYQTDNNGNLSLTLEKGAHTIYCQGAEKTVYVNNYSGAGTSYTRPGYYSLSFSVSPGVYVPVTDLNVSTESVDLSTQYGSNSAVVSAIVTPVDTTDDINWFTSSNQIVNIIPNGSTAEITAVAVGRAEISVSCGPFEKTIQVIVSNDPVVATDYYVSAENPDYYTVVAKDVHINRAISSPATVERVTMYTWSDPLQNDMNCKIIDAQGGTNDYSFTFPINDNAVNNYYTDAANILINIYAATDPNTNGNLIGSLTYNYNNPQTMPSGLGVTAYCANLGFIKPTFGNNTIAGAPDLSQPLEGIRVASPVEGVDVVCSVHVAGIGWMSSVSSGVYAGTMHQNRQIEAVKMKLRGENAESYRLSYQVTEMDGTVSEWCTDGQVAGTTGRALPLKAIQVNLVPVN